jgi:hypothetical protein
LNRDDARHASNGVLGGLEMTKIVMVVLAAAFALLIAQLVNHAPVIQTRVGEAIGFTAAPVMPPLMYAGIRG